MGDSRSKAGDGYSFFEEVYKVVADIPYGEVATYGQIAHLLGSPRAARQVGWAMRRCPEDLPWQRVVMADGTITGGDHAEIRRAFLESEGIPFAAEWRVDIDACAWVPEDEK